MLDGLNFILLHVPDIEEARAFYTEKLDFEVASQVPTFIQFKQAGNSATFALQETAGATPYKGVELWWQVADADAIYTRLVGRGVKVVSPPKDEPFGRAVSIEDHAGNTLNMYQPPSGR
jgi:predicted enzyme related to lactoylglutathione lyase